MVFSNKHKFYFSSLKIKIMPTIVNQECYFIFVRGVKNCIENGHRRQLYSELHENESEKSLYIHM